MCRFPQIVDDQQHPPAKERRAQPLLAGFHIAFTQQVFAQRTPPVIEQVANHRQLQAPAAQLRRQPAEYGDNDGPQREMLRQGGEAALTGQAGRLDVAEEVVEAVGDPKPDPGRGD